ncbi:MAG: hypothetical protein JWQ98_1680 [Chlorobi bacterium]|nr:hypothetical protein [Chlorobiota bacterium]
METGESGTGHDTMNMGNIIRYLLPSLILLLSVRPSADATVRRSVDDGRWDIIEWSPAGVPLPGDTVVIGNEVTGLQEGVNLGEVVIEEGGRLTIRSGSITTGSLWNRGWLTLGGMAILRVAGDLANDGAIIGGGLVEMTGDRSTLSGYGAFGDLLVNIGAGGDIGMSTSVGVRALSLGAGSRLIAGAHDLVVDGPFSSESRFGEASIIATTGTITLNGEVHGSARGNVRIGPSATPVSKRAPPLTVYGVLGDSGHAVTIAASRRFSFSRLIGDVRVDSGARADAHGIGTSGGSIIAGSLLLHGTLSATDESYRWIVDGGLRNRGTIENCTVMMRGPGDTLDNTGGHWDATASLAYGGPSGGVLTLLGDIVVPRLSIDPRSPLDSNVIVNAGRYTVRIRHNYTSDIPHGCRLVSDTLVRIWGASHGSVTGDVVFEGFRGSAIGGRYGAPGRRVKVAMPKVIDRRLVADGPFTSDPPAHLTIADTLALSGRGTLRGEIELGGGRPIIADSDLTVERDVEGSGVIVMTGSAPLFDLRAGLGDGIRMEAGGPRATRLSIARSLRVSRLWIHAGSAIIPRPGDSVLAPEDFQYDIPYPAGFSMASVACAPFTIHAASFFNGATSNIFHYDGGYQITDTMHVGEGYFLRFPVATTISHHGSFLNVPLVIAVRPGWNLIGGGSIPVSVSRVTAQGTTLASQFVTTLGGSQFSTTIDPGRGYWVKVNGAGTITLNPDP